MSKLPVISARELELILFHLGFKRKRQVGSHVLFQHSDGRATVVPCHAGEDIGRGLLRKILRDVQVEPEEYLKLRRAVL
ncbi:MAG: type II toxin-antitoxin system HicA family toxin [Syntrophomonas sp.]